MRSGYRAYGITVRPDVAARFAVIVERATAREREEYHRISTGRPVPTFQPARKHKITETTTRRGTKRLTPGQLRKLRSEVGKRVASKQREASIRSAASERQRREALDYVKPHYFHGPRYVA